jgi:hypothetical protein
MPWHGFTNELQHLDLPTFARMTGVICPPGGACELLSIHARKNILISRNLDLAYGKLIPPRCKGRIAVVTTREAGMRWTREALTDERRLCGRRSGVVLAPQRSGAKFAGDAFHASRGRWWQTGWFTKESAYKP